MKPGFMDVTLKRQDNHHKRYQNFPLIHQICSNVKVILIIFLGYWVCSAS